MALALDADVPALLRRGALEVLGRQLALSRDLVTLAREGVRAPLSINREGRYIPSAFDFGEDPTRHARGLGVSWSYFERASSNERPGFSSGGLRRPYTEDGPR